MMIIASVLGGRVLAPLGQVVAQWNSVVNFRGAWSRLEALLAAIPPKTESMALPAPKGLLTVEGLMAGAPGQNVPIIRGIQLALMPGEVLAVVGPSASGKTTLARMLVGLWPAMSGKVRLDGADVHAWDKSELGPYVGYLPQGVELLDGTIAENISRFGELDMAQVEAAAKLVGLHDLIWPCLTHTTRVLAVTGRCCQEVNVNALVWRVLCMANPFLWCSTSPTQVWTKQAMPRWLLPLQP
jgi:ATP-binding cassette subfamily C exporter for protease/lipase